jgi:hypothetical protein
MFYKETEAGFKVPCCLVKAPFSKTPCGACLYFVADARENQRGQLNEKRASENRVRDSRRVSDAASLSFRPPFF